MPQGDQADPPGPLAGEPRERAGAGAAAVVAETVSYQAASRFRMRIRWLVPALRLPGEVARDTVIVYRALLMGGASDAPNTFVLGIDPERDVMVLHQLMAEGEGEGT